MIGDRIKSIRKGKNLTLKAFAEKLSTSPGFISEIENGIKMPGYDLLTSLKRIFDADLNWLVSGKEIIAEPEHPYASGLVSEDERELLRHFRNMSEKHRLNILEMAQCYEYLGEGQGARGSAVSGSVVQNFKRRSTD